MNIGFFLKWWKNCGQVVGEELYALSLCKELLILKGVKHASLYTPNDFSPAAKLDVMIYLNDTPPMPSYTQKHVLYMQNIWPQGSDIVLKELHKFGYDGYVFASHRLLELHRAAGHAGIFLPFAADIEVFQPRAKNPRYAYDVAYVGNDIKGEERTMRYIYPATDFHFGLFGHWPNCHQHPYFHQYPYQERLAKISQGLLGREEQAVLYPNAKIILNCTGQDSVNWDVLNLRFFEVLACKGFLISDRVPSAEHEFKDCVVFTDGGDDLTRKIEYYLARPNDRKEIAEKGNQYVIKNATVKARAKQLYQYLQEII